MVGGGDDRRIVVDDEDGVLPVPQAGEQRDQSLNVTGVQPGGRLVEDIGHLGQWAPQVADHLHPLWLTAGQGRRRPVEVEVTQPDLDQGVHPAGDVREQRGGTLPQRLCRFNH